MVNSREKSVIGLLAATALLLGTVVSGMAQSASGQLPTGWKTPSELYAQLAKLPPDQLDQVSDHQ